MSQKPEFDLASLGMDSRPAFSQGFLRSAKKEQLKFPRGILLLIGALTIASGGYEVSKIGPAADLECQRQIDCLHAKGLTADQNEVAQSRNRFVRIHQLICGGAVALGMVFLVLGIMVYAYPITATTLGLILYVGGAALTGFLAPQALLPGALMRIVVVVILAAAVRTAIAFRKVAVT